MACLHRGLAELFLKKEEIKVSKACLSEFAGSFWSGSVFRVEIQLLTIVNKSPGSPGRCGRCGNPGCGPGGPIDLQIGTASQ